MKENNSGIYQKSDLYFYNTSPQNKKFMFYLICTGHYYCNTTYSVSRQNYNSYLIMYIEKGSGFVCFNDINQEVKEGNIIIINCHKPHSYFTETGWEIYWAHFDGVLCPDFFEQITKTTNVFESVYPHKCRNTLCKIFNMFYEHKSTCDAVFSKLINDMLTELLMINNSADIKHSVSDAVDNAISYISENTNKAITLNDLAKQVSLSPYYFSRIFKKETGYTPYSYILLIKMEYAKFLLKTSDLSITSIALKCGFGSDISFCNCFKKNTGYSPTRYRKSTK